jgi:hypothetical protein
MTARPLVVASAAVVVLTGCGGVRDRVRGWADDAPPPPSHGSTRPETYYTAGALPVHAKPSDASKVVGRLAPNTRVTRTQVDRGWARIATDDVEGWVDASRLVHHPPAAGPPAPAVETPDAPAPDHAPVTAPTPKPTRPPPAVEDPF